MSPTLDRIRESYAAFWQQRNVRERTMLTLAAAVIALALVYAVLIAPALGGRAQLEKNLPGLRLQAAEMQTLAQQASQLANRPPPARLALSRESIEAALARKGLKAQNLVVSGDMVKLQLASVSFAATLDWLDEMQRTAGMTVVDSNIVALAQSDTVSVTLTLRQQKSETEQ